MIRLIEDWRKDANVGFRLYYNSYGMNLHPLRPRETAQNLLLSLLDAKSKGEAFTKVCQHFVS